MLTKDELQKRIQRDDELYSQLSKERRTVYQRLRRYRNLAYHMQCMENELSDENMEDESGGIKTYNGKPYTPGDQYK
jgi:hypothetical protein